MRNTKIKWTGPTWNPTTGCEKAFNGCNLWCQKKASKGLLEMAVERSKNKLLIKIFENDGKK